MDESFDNDAMTDAEGLDDLQTGTSSPFDESASGDEGDAAWSTDVPVSSGDEFYGADFEESADGFDSGDGFVASGSADNALWNVFEEEIADGLDASDTDEFIGRLLGGLGRAAGVVGRGLGTAGAAAGRAGQVAQRVGRVAGAVSPAAMAAARLARLLGASNAAGVLGQVGGIARNVGRAAGRGQGMAASLGQAAGGMQGLFGQLSQLLGQGTNELDAFDAVVDLYADDGIDEALPAAVALAARAAARGLGLRNVAHLSQAGRRALVRGVASAARELVQSQSPQAVRALPRLTRSVARVAQRRMPTPGRAVQALQGNLPQTARRVAQNPRVLQRLTQQPRRLPAPPLSRPTNLGHGVPRPPRSYRFSGPVTLTITPR